MSTKNSYKYKSIPYNDTITHDCGYNLDLNKISNYKSNTIFFDKNSQKLFPQNGF